MLSSNQKVALQTHKSPAPLKYSHVRELLQPRVGSGRGSPQEKGELAGWCKG